MIASTSRRYFVAVLFIALAGSAALASQPSLQGRVIAGGRTMPAVAQESILHYFAQPPDAASSLAALIADGTGALYGTTQWGGANGGSRCAIGQCGAVFKLTPAGTRYKETVIHSFGAAGDGYFPAAALLSDKTGDLFGTTVNGGAHGFGTVFELIPSGAAYTEKVIYSFGGATDGASPYGGLIEDSAGALYGTTSGGAGGSGQGTVFKLTASAGHWNLTTLYQFTGQFDGGNPQATLLAGAHGDLFGTTVEGGHGGRGTVFELKPSGAKYVESVICDFSKYHDSDGQDPYDAVIADASGALYGTTSSGGDAHGGVVFKLTPAKTGYVETILYRFGPSAAGAAPFGGLVETAPGTLYGTTSSGGAFGDGTIFKLTAAKPAYHETIVYDFGTNVHGKALDGEDPNATLLYGPGNALYGATAAGGVFGRGVVFKVTP